MAKLNTNGGNTEAENKTTSQNLLTLIDKRVHNILSSVASKFSKTRKGTVLAYNESNFSTIVSFNEDDSERHTYYNKTGEYLYAGDTVGVTYWTSLERGILNIRYGEYNPLFSAGSLEPITAITINSDTDYLVSTNAGMEKYIAVFEDE